ncbi:membrane cofactor protein-like isoform X12 [Acanthochromis polyacanthus]|uniref:membrane cofactor protein-like isoform X12 n=1 Tax=Acanthochromis polyacanthus TaxID=80966 RepID=UPI0022345317|nr:membrane cofactor protein-like isoform X12 [Acanthochromis polyacanthus]
MVASTLLLLSLGLLTAQAQNCSKPVGGPNMDLSDNDILLNTFPDGHKAYFRCDVGYTSAGGSKVIICSAGIWSPVLLKCERKNCGSAGVVDNGEIDYPNGALFSDKAVITCNEGYILVGKREITCGDQGWMDRLPVCEVLKCDPPADIADGKFSPNKESYEYREVVQYSCRNDYTLHGSKSLSCSENGTFTPAPPTCTKVECKDPKIENGMWKEGARPPYRHGSAVTLQCNSGYIMKGAPYLTCDINSLWSPGLPQCTLDDGKGGDGKGDGHNGSDVGKSVGIAFAVLAPIAAVGLFFIYKKKRSRKHKTVKEAPKAGEDVALS